MRGERAIATIADLLADGGSIKTGPFGTTLKASEYSSVGVPLISVGEIGYGTFRIHEKTPRVSPAVTTRLAEYVLQEGDIVFGRKGAVDRSARISAEQHGWFLGSDGIRLRLPETTDSRFMAFQLQSPASRNWILQHATGTTMASLNQDVIGRIPISLPPLPEQRAIARILGALDDKIELNRKTNATLEAMARALFKSWFVDFDPVRAKAEGRTPSGMDADTAKLFPSEFFESEMGPIPKSWHVSKLGELLELKRGYDLPASQRSLGRVPIISSSGPTGVHDQAKVAGPGIVTGRYGTIGQVFLVREDFWPLNTTLYVRDLKGTQLHFAYHMLSAIDFEKFSDKAAVPGINRNHVHEERVVAAPQQVQRRFDEFVELWAKQREQRGIESLLMIRLRDALLPRLLSGEISVAHAEREAEAVA